MAISPIGMDTTSMNNQSNNNAISNSMKLNKEMYMTLFLQALQNQSPMDTMDNAQMMQQMSQLGFMEQVENMKLAIEDMKEMQEGQNLQNAAGMLGRTIVAINSDGEKVVGVASALRIKDGSIEYLVNKQVVQAAQIQEVGLASSNMPQNSPTANKIETESNTNAEGNGEQVANAVEGQGETVKLSPFAILEREKMQIEEELKAV